MQELAGSGSTRLPKKQRRYAPRLTAASYRYFERGKGSAPAPGDVVVQARRRVHLKPYDVLLKQFKYAPGFVAVCCTVWGQMRVGRTTAAYLHRDKLMP